MRWSLKQRLRTEPCIVHPSWTSLSSQEFGVGATVSEKQRSSRLRGDFVKDTNDGYYSNRYYDTTTRVRKTSSRRNICLHTGHNGRCTVVTENSEVRMSRYFGYVYQNTSGPKPWSNMEDPVVPLERNLYGHPPAGRVWGKAIRQSSTRTRLVTVPNLESLFVNREKVFSCLNMWTV